MKNLYDTFPLTTDFTAKITSCTPAGKEKYSVTLTETAFFPAGAGRNATPDISAARGLAQQESPTGKSLTSPTRRLQSERR